MEHAWQGSIHMLPWKRHHLKSHKEIPIHPINSKYLLAALMSSLCIGTAGDRRVLWQGSLRLESVDTFTATHLNPYQGYVYRQATHVLPKWRHYVSVVFLSYTVSWCVNSCTTLYTQPLSSRTKHTRESFPDYNILSHDSQSLIAIVLKKSIDGIYFGSFLTKLWLLLGLRLTKFTSHV